MSISYCRSIVWNSFLSLYPTCKGISPVSPAAASSPASRSDGQPGPRVPEAVSLPLAAFACAPASPGACNQSGSYFFIFSFSSFGFASKDLREMSQVDLLLDAKEKVPEMQILLSSQYVHCRRRHFHSIHNVGSRLLRDRSPVRIPSHRLVHNWGGGSGGGCRAVRGDLLEQSFY